MTTPRFTGEWHRAADQRWWWKLTHFLLAPLVDSWAGLSLTRFLAIFCCVLVGHNVLWHDRALTWIDFWLIVAAISAAFGKALWLAFLARMTNTTTVTDTVTTDVAAVIKAARGDLPYEPAP